MDVLVTLSAFSSVFAAKPVPSTRMGMMSFSCKNKTTESWREMLVGRCPSPLDADGDDVLFLQKQNNRKLAGDVGGKMS